MMPRALIEHALQASGLTYSRFSALHLDRSAGNSRMMSMLVFLDGEKNPRVYIKTAPADQAPAGFRTEYDNLAALARSRDEVLVRSVPAPLHIGEYGGLHLLVESVLPGSRLKNLPPLQYLNSPRLHSHLQQIVDWLLAFRTALAGPPIVLTGDSLERYVTTPIGEFRKSYQPTPALNDLLDRSARSLRDREIPFTPWHGDFCTANVLADEDDRIGVIDWEHPIENGWPMADLLHFLSSLWCVPPSKSTAQRLDNYSRIFFRQGPLYQPIRDSAGRYARELGIDRSLLQPLTVLIWIEYANRKAEYSARIGADDGPSAQQHLPLVLVEDGRCLNLELLAERPDEYVLNDL